jgi:hypothetical protein
MKFNEDYQIKTIIKLYVEYHLSLNHIAKICKRNRQTIANLLKKNNINLRPKHICKRCFSDSDYFKIINSEKKAYWLGFLYADGYVCKNYIGLKLAIKDLNHLINFSQELKSTHAIVKDVSHRYRKEYEYCSINIYNQQLVKDLLNAGCLHNKSLILKFPTQDILPENLTNHFIRGYFDGDGCIHYSIKKIKHQICPGVDFIGTENMLERIKYFVMPDSKSNIRKKDNIYVLTLGGIHQVQKIYHYLYENATIYLERKHNKFLEIFNLKGL